MKSKTETKLIIPGNIGIPSFINCIIAATIQLRKDQNNEELAFDQIHVFHTEESIKALMGNREWQSKLKIFGIPNINFIHHVVDIENDNEKGFDQLIRQLRDIINPLDTTEYYMDLSRGRSSLLSILSVFAYVLDIKHIYTLEVDFSNDPELRRKQSNYYWDEIEKDKSISKRYKKFPEIRSFDRFGNRNFTEVIRYKNVMDEILDSTEGIGIVDQAYAQVIREILLSGINLRLLGKANEDNKNNYLNSTFSFAAAIEEMTNLALMVAIPEFDLNSQEDKQKNYLSNKIVKLNQTVNNNSKYFIDENVLNNLGNLISSIRNDTVHHSPKKKRNPLISRLQADISQHLALNYIQFISKSVSSFLDERGSIVTTESLESHTPNDDLEYYFGFDGDGTGDYIESAFYKEDSPEKEVIKRSKIITDALKKLRSIICETTKNKDAVLFSAGDNILFRSKMDTDLIERLLKKYKEMTSLEGSIGYGPSLHEATIALKLAKAKKGQKVMGIRIKREGQTQI